MTGFAEAAGSAAGWHAVVRVRSVNHRYLDLRWQIPPEAEGWAAEAETRIRGRLRRGHVEVRAALAAAGATAARLDHARLEAYLEAFAELNRRLGGGATAEPAEILRLPGILGASAEAGAADWRPLLDALLEQALDKLVAVRQAEGATLVRDLRARRDAVATLRAQAAARSADAAAAIRERLERRMRELAVTAVPGERIAQEAALLAERSDISEELIRIDAHLGQLARLLDAGGEVGKPLDFLLQELHREANTLLSKSSGAGDAGLDLTHHALGMKAEIEKMREQAQNLE